MGPSVSSQFSAALVLMLAASAVAEHNPHAVHTAQPPARKLRSSVDAASMDPRAALLQAVSEALGAGHDIHSGHLLETRENLLPMWRALAKNAQGRIDRRSLRYVVHRYFLQKYSLSLVGLEPLQANSSHDEAALIAAQLPSFVRNAVEGKGASKGFSIEDTAALIAVLERLVADDGQETLEAAYHVQGLDPQRTLSVEEVMVLAENYLIRWMMGDDIESAEVLEANRTLVEETFENWQEIQHFARGRVSTFEHAGWSSPRAFSSDAGAWGPLERRFSFEDVRTVASGITISFGGFWETECARVKESLVRMQDGETGRVKLSDFHGAALGGEWRFSESKEYLRQLGALDESLASGPRVVIANYMQAASNCIVSQHHYRVCCPNECEDYVSEIEAKVKAPTATPEFLLAIVSNMTAKLDEQGPRVQGKLASQLREIADVNGGRIPIHGRLFAQWLHYVFPLECPFPHKAGTTTAMTPSEYGQEYMASEEEMSSHTVLPAQVSAVEAQASGDDWMSQWSHEEELVMDQRHLQAPWESRVAVPALALVLATGGLLFCLFGNGKSSSVLGLRSDKDVLPMTFSRGKSHWV